MEVYSIHMLGKVNKPLKNSLLLKCNIVTVIAITTDTIPRNNLHSSNTVQGVSIGWTYNKGQQETWKTQINKVRLWN